MNSSGTTSSRTSAVVAGSARTQNVTRRGFGARRTVPAVPAPVVTAARAALTGRRPGTSLRGLDLRPHRRPGVALLGGEVRGEVGGLQDVRVVDRERLLQRLV